MVAGIEHVVDLFSSRSRALLGTSCDVSQIGESNCWIMATILSPSEPGAKLASDPGLMIGGIVSK